MRHLLAFSSIVLLAGLSACGKESESTPSSPSTSEARKLASSVRVGSEGGTIERGKAKVEFPAEALVREQSVDLVEAGEVEAFSYTPAGPAFSLQTEQAMFARPVTVTLPIDASRLPPGTLPEQVTAVFAQDGLGERLEGAKVDLAAGTLTVTLERAMPLVHAQATAAPASPPVLQAAVGPMLGVILTTNQAIYRAPKDMVGAAEMAEELRGVLKAVLERYKDMAVPQGGPLLIELAVLHERVTGFASGTHQLTMNPSAWSTDVGPKRAATLAHEYFHLIQHRFIMRNLQKTGTMVPPDIRARGQANWLWEATAVWMETHLIPTAGQLNLSRLTRNFCYLPLNQFDSVSTAKNSVNPDNPHQYAAFIFFSYLDTLYVGRKIVIDTWSDYLSGAWTRIDLATDAGQGRGCFNPLDVLDRILKATPDNQGRTRSLREVYADFLIHYNWFKDFGPIAGGAHKQELGEAQDLVLPGRIEAWSLPFEENNKRQMKKSMTVQGVPYAIVKAFHIKNGLDPKAKEKGDLEVKLGLAPDADVKDSLLVVFPFKRGAEAPLVGNAENPVLRRNWQNDIGAVVWVVDLSENAGWGLTMTAEVKAADEMQFELSGQIPGEPFTESTSHTPVFFLSFAAPAGVDVKTEAGRKQFDALSGKWAKRMEKERRDRVEWLHITATVGGKPHHYYGRIGNTNAPGVSVVSGKMVFPRKPGTYQVEAKTSFRGQALSFSYPVTVKIADWRQPAANDSIRLKLQEIENLRAQKAGAEFICREYSSLGTQYAGIMSDDAAIEAWNAGLALAGDDVTRNGFFSQLARLALERGDIDAYMTGMEKSGQSVNHEDCAKWVLALQNNPKKAKELKRKVPNIKDDALELFREWPNEGDEIVH